MELRRVAVADSRGRSDGVLQIGPRDRAFAPAMDGTGGRRAAVRIEFHRFPAIQPVGDGRGRRSRAVPVALHRAIAADALRLRTVPSQRHAAGQSGGDAAGRAVRRCAAVAVALRSGARRRRRVASRNGAVLYLHYLGQRRLRLSGGDDLRAAPPVRTPLAQEVVGGILRRPRGRRGDGTRRRVCARCELLGLGRPGARRLAFRCSGRSGGVDVQAGGWGQGFGAGDPRSRRCCKAARQSR